MTALTAERDTPQMGDDAVIDLHSLPVDASKKIYRGSIVVVGTSGYAAPGSAALSLVAVGRAEQTVDNSSGAAGDLKVKVRSGTFRFGNSATTDALTTADIGAACYLVDDQTVARTAASGTRSYAGRVQDVDATGVWVEIGTRSDPSVEDKLLLAAADLSALQNTFVAQDTNSKAAAASSAGQDCIGVLLNAPASGAVAVVRVRGRAKVFASTTIAKGARVATTNAGLSKTAVAATIAAATVGSALSAVATADGSDAGTTQTLANALKAAYNLNVALVNQLRTAVGSAQNLSGSYVLGIAEEAGSGSGAVLHAVYVAPMGAIPTTPA